MSFLKFVGETSGNGRGEIHWSRAGSDGAPYRGHGAPLLRDHEFEQLAERVVDSYHGTFNTSQPDMRQPANSPHGRTLQEILERRENNWFEIKSWNERWFETDDGPVMFVFVVWSEPYQELPQSVLHGKVATESIAKTVQGISHAGSKPSPSSGPPALLQ